MKPAPYNPRRITPKALTGLEQAIYVPRGAAREYAPLALNLYRGCSHGCLYCFAPGCLHMTREEFSKPAPRAGIIEALWKQVEGPTWDAVKRRTPILLCFTTDPYQSLDERERQTRHALVALSGRARVAILTKGGAGACRDFDLMRVNGWSLGATLTTLGDAEARKWEPGAASASERASTLLEAQRLGISTWVSVEPVLDARRALDVVRWAADHEIPTRLGRWNHDVRANAMDWAELLRRALVIAEAHPGWAFYVKDELAKAGPVPAKFRVRPLG